MKCSICGKPIVLVPSAAERARRYGGEPSDYTRLFTEHSDCVIAKREKDTLELIRSLDSSKLPKAPWETN